MYVNKCTKCGAEFETKNPKRVICPNCLYPDKKSGSEDSGENQQNQSGYQNSDSHSESYERPSAYSAGGYSSDNYQRREERPYQQDRSRYDGQRSYNRDGGYNRPQGGYSRPQGGYNRPQSGGYNNDRGYDRPRQPRQYDRDGGQQRGYNRDGGYNRPQGGYNRPQGGYNRPQGGGYNRSQGNYNRSQGSRRPMGGRPQNKPPKQLLVNKEQLALIEELYKKMLPLPNPDAHEVIGEQIGLEARKVFFGINLVRQKMMLPKLAFPKRKLAVSHDQLNAIKMFYEPLLPLPPIGCHKIIAAQLKIDEWRVHVGIGLIRKQLGLDRWNPERPDAPAEFKQQAAEPAEPAKEQPAEVPEVEAVKEEKPKRGRKKASEEKSE